MKTRTTQTLKHYIDFAILTSIIGLICYGVDYLFDPSLTTMGTAFMFTLISVLLGTLRLNLNSSFKQIEGEQEDLFEKKYSEMQTTEQLNIAGILALLDSKINKTVAIKNIPENVKPTQLLNISDDMGLEEMTETLRKIDLINTVHLQTNQENLSNEQQGKINILWTSRQNLIKLWEKASIEYIDFLESQKKCFDLLSGSLVDEIKQSLLEVGIKRKDAFISFMKEAKQFNLKVEEGFAVKQDISFTKKPSTEKTA